ncbi:histidine--tRNA ligase [bacterium]|nr:histidine--tRNA ligase [bacterium]
MAKNKINTSVLSGFVELLPQSQFVFDTVKSIIENTYKNAGFVAIDTPTIEKSEVLFAKAGGETEKQVYRFTKGDNDLSLRFDLTVPFARYVADHYANLTFPFKRYQIGKVYRGERAQKGRYREFFQADIDIVAENNLSIMYDVEIISTIIQTISKLSSQFNLGNFKVKVSNRKIWDGFFKQFGFDDTKKVESVAIIDKRYKFKTEDDFKAELKEKIGDEKIFNLAMALLKIEYIPNVGISIPESHYNDFSFIKDNELMREGISELETVMKYLPLSNTEVDLSIVRGLDYYTGTVFETYLQNYPEFGSVSSGGRYEHLCDFYTDKIICGVGGSIGLSRLFIPLIEDGKIQIDTSMTDIVILPQNENCYTSAIKIKTELNEKVDAKVNVIFENKKFKKMMEYANKINAKFAIIIGDDELQNNTFTLKNMITGEQQTISSITLIKTITKTLNK